MDRTPESELCRHAPLRDDDEPPGGPGGGGATGGGGKAPASGGRVRSRQSAPGARYRSVSSSRLARRRD
jgi:hypothetical protein